MKKYVGLMIGMVLLALPISAFAAEYKIVYQDEQFSIEEDSLLETEMVWMPGDTIMQTYSVSNQSQEKVRMYLEIATIVELPEEMKDWVKIQIQSKEKGWLHVLGTTESNGGYMNERIGTVDVPDTNDLLAQQYLVLLLIGCGLLISTKIMKDR